MTIVGTLVALVNVSAIVPSMAVCTCLVHQTIARLALARERSVRVDAIHVVVTIVWRSRGERGRQGAFVHIRTEKAITPVACLGTLTCVASCRYGTDQVCANSVGATEVRTQRTLVNVGTGDTVTCVPRWAAAAEAASCVHAVVRVETVVRCLCALVNLRACICRRSVARLASARTPDEMWQVGWTSKAVCAAPSITRDAARVAGRTRRSSAIEVADRADGDALTVVQEGSNGWAGEAITGGATACRTTNLARLANRI